MTDQAPTPSDRPGSENADVPPDKSGELRIRMEVDPISLPERFIRVGKRGTTWNLPRSFADYKAAPPTELSVAGAAPKFILRSISNPDDWYIVKSAEMWGRVETLTELLNNRLGSALGFPMADAGIIRVDGALCFASHNFQLPGETLIHGSLLFRRVFNDDLGSVGKKRWDEQRTYDVDLISEMLKEMCGPDGDALFGRLLEMLIFDALIGSMDRHMQNWGLLATVSEPRTYRFAPIFDSARALLWNQDESKLEILCNQSKALEAYLERVSPIMGFASTGKPVNHFALVEHLLKRHPGPVLEALDRIRPRKVSKAARIVREFPFNLGFSNARASLVTKVLVMRADRLDQITRERR
jgi:hypothetical protein